MTLNATFSVLLSYEQVDATAKGPDYVASTNSYSSLHSQAFQPCPPRTIYFYLSQQKSTSSPLDSHSD